LDNPVPAEWSYQEWDRIDSAPFVTVYFKYRSIGKQVVSHYHYIILMPIVQVRYGTYASFPTSQQHLFLKTEPEQDLNSNELLQLVRQSKMGCLSYPQKVGTKHRKERDAAALKIKKKTRVKRELSRSAETVGNNDIMILKALNRKRCRAEDKEIIVLD
jgi:hypothetical protein